MISLASLATATSRKEGAPTRSSDTSEGFVAHFRSGESAAAASVTPAMKEGGQQPGDSEAVETKAGAASTETGNAPAKSGKSLPPSLPPFAATLEKLPGKMLLAASPAVATSNIQGAPNASATGKISGDGSATALGEEGATQDTSAAVSSEGAATGDVAIGVIMLALPQGATAATAIPAPSDDGNHALPTQAKLALPVGADGGAEGADKGAMADAQQGQSSPGQPSRAGSASVTVAPEAQARNTAQLSEGDGSVLKLGERTTELSAPTTPLPTGSRTDASAAAAPMAKLGVVQQAMHDLTQIVDRLSAARQALAPAAASLAINHAEFGELSLRFDQNRDGHLAVQIAAGNPEAHRAVAAAMGQQPFSGTADQQAGQGAQTFSQSQSATRDANAGGGRDGGAGSEGSTSRDQPHQRRSPGAQNGARQSDQGRSGIFA